MSYALPAAATAAVGGNAVDAAVVYTPGPFEIGFEGFVEVNFNGDSAHEFDVSHTRATYFSSGRGNFSPRPAS